MQTTADALVTTLIQARFDAWIAAWPGQATRFGIHHHDGRLPDLSRAAKLADIASEHAFVRGLQAVDPKNLSVSVAFERELALHSARLRLFEDDAGKMNRDLAQAGGEVLAVSQFTLVGSVRRGRRPSFEGAARPEQAEPMFNEFVDTLRGRGLSVQTGIFGAHMEVDLCNDGPVTLLLDSGDRLASRRSSSSRPAPTVDD